MNTFTYFSRKVALFEPVHVSDFVTLISSPSSQGTDKPAHLLSLTRAFADYIHKMMYTLV